MNRRLLPLAAILAATVLLAPRPLPGDPVGGALGRIPVLDNGRVKPLDTYARVLLKQFSGRGSMAGEPAADWLARALFAPEGTTDDPLFLVNHPDVLGAMGVPATAGGRGCYSYRQLYDGLDRLQQAAMKALQRDEKARDAVDREIIRLSFNISLYVRLLDSLQFARPRPEFTVVEAETRQALGLQPAQSRLSWLDLALHAAPLQAAFADLPRTPSESWSEWQREVARLKRGLDGAASRLQESPLAILPPPGDAAHDAWLTPGAALASGQAQAQRGALRALAQAQAAYDSGLTAECVFHLDAFRRQTEKRAGAVVSPRTISLEVLYNRVDPFFVAEILYGAALLLGLLSMLFWRRRLGRMAFLLLPAALLFHTAGLAARMLIARRAPVTNLYETFVFVGWVCALLGLVLELIHKRGLGTGTGALSGLAFLLISGRYALDGDTMGMLVAVLNSNLWLATHVITISAGYAGCVLAGVIGHVYIIQTLRRSGESLLGQTFRSLYAVLAFGLVFTVIGTVMGGIWADQSWGRFWGWDPKENGALLIILWVGLLFHARPAGLIGRLGMAAGSIGAIVCVVLAWFGVNLLGVGLHSYGFTGGVALALLAFLFLEMLFLAVAVPLAWRRRSSEPSR